MLTWYAQLSKKITKSKKERTTERREGEVIMHFLHEVLSKEREIKLLERRMKNNGRGKRRKMSEKKEESEVKNNISRPFARNIKIRGKRIE